MNGTSLITLVTCNRPDILGICETFLDSSTPDNIISVTNYEFFREDRSCTINKAGGEVILYYMYRDSINCRRKTELEISNIETLCSEINFPSSIPFLLCTIYHPPPPNAPCDLIDLFEAELFVAQTTGFETIIDGDFNINYLNCSNKKWLHLVELFDLKQMITTPHPPRELLKIRALLLTIYTVQTKTISLIRTQILN